MMNEPQGVPQFLQGSEPAGGPVNHPRHYNGHPSGVEAIEIMRYMGCNLANAVKYVWRASLKNGTEDLKKARWYLRDMVQHPVGSGGMYWKDKHTYLQLRMRILGCEDPVYWRKKILAALLSIPLAVESTESVVLALNGLEKWIVEAEGG